MDQSNSSGTLNPQSGSGLDFSYPDVNNAGVSTPSAMTAQQHSDPPATQLPAQQQDISLETTDLPAPGAVADPLNTPASTYSPSVTQLSTDPASMTAIPSSSPTISPPPFKDDAKKDQELSQLKDATSAEANEANIEAEKKDSNAADMDKSESGGSESPLKALAKKLSGLKDEFVEEVDDEEVVKKDGSVMDSSAQDPIVAASADKALPDLNQTPIVSSNPAVPPVVPDLSVNDPEMSDKILDKPSENTSMDNNQNLPNVIAPVVNSSDMNSTSAPPVVPPTIPDLSSSDPITGPNSASTAPSSIDSTLPDENATDDQSAFDPLKVGGVTEDVPLNTVISASDADPLVGPGMQSSSSSPTASDMLEDKTSVDTAMPASPELDLAASTVPAPTPPLSESSLPPVAPSLDSTMSAATPTPSDTTAVAKPESDIAAPAATGGRYPYTIEQLLDQVYERGASDLHITVDYPVMLRVDGSLIAVNPAIVTEHQAQDLILAVLPEQKKELLEVNREVDLAYSHKQQARFRINAYYQQQSLAAAFRLIPNEIRSIDDLKLPQIYHQLSKLRQGLVLVTGPTGSGKSTTLASVLHEINLTRPDHIITIEDPIEYVFPKAMAMVDQRELHDDTHSWEIALKSALRQDPDVILVGEMRDYETISSAITLAETGHLVFATLHTNSAAQTVDRIIDVFPEHQQSQVRSQLSNVIEAVVAQRLIPLDKGGRTAVSEIMIATPAVRNLIREAKTHQLDNVIRTSADIGMISLEHSLVKLVREGMITMERAQENAVHPEEVVRLMKGTA